MTHFTRKTLVESIKLKLNAPLYLVNISQNSNRLLLNKTFGAELKSLTSPREFFAYRHQTEFI